MKRAVIFLHGDKPNISLVTKHRKKSDTIICADGGTMWAVASGLTPHIILGDFDSITPSLKAKLEKKDIEWYTFPREKDQTDSELTLAYALNHGYQEILIFGFLGSRFDHVIANLMLFADLISKGITISLFQDNEEMHLVTEKLSLTGKKSDYVSLIPLQGDVKGVTTSGLKWRLYNDILQFGKTLGISNEFTKKKAEITVDNGVLLVVHTKT